MLLIGTAIISGRTKYMQPISGISGSQQGYPLCRRLLLPTDKCYGSRIDDPRIHMIVEQAASLMAAFVRERDIADRQSRRAGRTDGLVRRLDQGGGAASVRDLAGCPSRGRQGPGDAWLAALDRHRGRPDPHARVAGGQPRAVPFAAEPIRRAGCSTGRFADDRFPLLVATPRPLGPTAPPVAPLRSGDSASFFRRACRSLPGVPML